MIIMGVESIRDKVKRIDVDVVGVANVFSKTEDIQGIIHKVAVVSGTMLSGTFAITDTQTGENVWNENSVSLETTSPVRYPKVSGSTVAGVTLSSYDEKVATSNITISLTGITPATGTATCYIYFK